MKAALRPATVSLAKVLSQVSGFRQRRSGGLNACRPRWIARRCAVTTTPLLCHDG